MEYSNGSNDDKKQVGSVNGAFSYRPGKWVSGGIGGLVGAVGTVLVIVIPVINTWLANTKEISLAQIKTTQEQIDFTIRRMQDSEKERDLYRQEMTVAQTKGRELDDKLATCQRELREIRMSK